MLEGSAPDAVVEAFELVVGPIKLWVGAIAAVVEALELVVGPIKLGVEAIAAVVEALEGVAPYDRVVGKWPKACRVSEVLGALRYCSMVQEHCRSLAMVHSCLWVVEHCCSMTVTTVQCNIVADFWEVLGYLTNW